MTFSQLGSKTSSVNMSLGAISKNSNGTPIDSSRCIVGEGQDFVNKLFDRGIAVTVGLPNQDMPAGVRTWPACLNHVIKVGADRAKFDSNRGLGIGANGIDFFAKDFVSSPSSVGSSLAAPRVAAAYAILHHEYPFASVNDLTRALKRADLRMADYTSNGIKFTKRNLKKSDLVEARKILDFGAPNAVGPQGIIAASDFEYQDFEEHGPLFNGPETGNYSFDIDFSEITGPILVSKPIQTKSIVSLSGKRDVALSFTGIVSSGNGSFTIRVNGSSVETILGFKSGVEKQASLVINRRFFNRTKNSVSITRDFGGEWGVKNLTANFHPSINITVGVQDIGEYGYERTPARLTGLRANFLLTDIEGNYRVSMVGWDIDLASETSVFVNGEFLGNLTKGISSSIYSRRDRFTISKSILRVGENHLEFVQRDLGADWADFEDEKWAVKDILIEPFDAISIAPIMMLLLGDENN